MKFKNLKFNNKKLLIAGSFILIAGFTGCNNKNNVPDVAENISDSSSFDDNSVTCLSDKTTTTVSCDTTTSDTYVESLTETNSYVYSESYVYNESLPVTSSYVYSENLYTTGSTTDTTLTTTISTEATTYPSVAQQVPLFGEVQSRFIIEDNPVYCLQDAYSSYSLASLFVSDKTADDVIYRLQSKIIHVNGFLGTMYFKKGDKLIIPDVKGVYYVTSGNESMADICDYVGVSYDEICKLNGYNLFFEQLKENTKILVGYVGYMEDHFETNKGKAFVYENNVIYADKLVLSSGFLGASRYGMALKNTNNGNVAMSINFESDCKFKYELVCEKAVDIEQVSGIATAIVDENTINYTAFDYYRDDDNMYLSNLVDLSTAGLTKLENKVKKINN